MRSFIQKLGPGLLFAGAAIGVSHLVQSTRAGADYGFSLVWALLLVHLFKYPFFQYGPRYAMATGETLLDGYRKIGKWALITYFVITLATMFTIQTAVTIVTAGLAANLFGVTTNPVTWSIIITFICLLILLLGKYRFLDNLMKIIVCVLSVSTVIAVIVAVNGNGQPMSLKQIIPTDIAGITFLIAFMGWMPAPLDVSIWQSLWAIEKRKINKDYDTKQSLFDFNIGYLSTVFLGLFFITLGAVVMHGTGDSFASGASLFASQLIELYTKSLGNFSYLIIALAAFTTMFSTTLTTLDASPRSMVKCSSLLFNRTHKSSYLFWIGLLVTGTLTILLFFLSEMKTLVEIATIVSFITAPFYAVINFALISSKHTPKEWHPSILLKTVSYLGIIFLSGFSIWYLTTL
ncbi:Nramp family divalent metal transporter [Zhouia spongiae]|uniref:Nramp family divalent metal transporter n=1 Tax=Zhouia spongiae TaxID=2202721 RepID=A0ABY3YPE2_9FLAO|nr:Nramp family divalent metal transporter [Zhouia spongiae]UNY99003.1 Nramp family divalent metal transporter [Zhouia spongiae]